MSAPTPWHIKLKQIARAHGYTQKTLATALHKRVGTIVSWYRATREPSDAEKQDIALLLGVSITDIWGAWESPDAHDYDADERRRPMTRAEWAEHSGLYVGQRMLRILSDWRGNTTRAVVTIVELGSDFVRIQYERGYYECYSYQAIAHDKDLKLLKTSA